MNKILNMMTDTMVIKDKNETNAAIMPDRRLAPRTVRFINKPRVIGRGAIAGPTEKDGPLCYYIPQFMESDKYGEKTFEKAESKMLTTAIQAAIDNAGLSGDDIDVMLLGDLVNQITPSTFAARSFERGYLGIYSACSNMTESLILGGMTIDAGFCNTVACATGSHYATAERQYRGPLELGSQKQQYCQRTVTGAGCTILGKGKGNICLSIGTVGRVVDFGITDVANMGAAMAPAAMDTLSSLFADTNTMPCDYDLIASGDLGKLGSDALRDLIAQKGYKLGKEYSDCGCLMYSIGQKNRQGGSGCGCSAVTLNSYIFDKMLNGEFNRVIFIATGALMSPLSALQGETIPCIAHAVVFERI